MSIAKKNLPLFSLLSVMCIACPEGTTSSDGTPTDPPGNTPSGERGIGQVVGSLGAPPSADGQALTKAQGLIQSASDALSVTDLTVVFVDEDGTEVEASPDASGNVSTSLPEGRHRVYIKQDPLSPVVYNTETQIDVRQGATANFYLPRISWFALHKAAKVDACGKKVSIDAASGRFALGSHMGLVVGRVTAPDEAALIYDEHSFNQQPALVSLTEGGNRAFVVFPGSLRVYDLSDLTPGTVLDCSNQDCYEEHELSDRPNFPIDPEFCGLYFERSAGDSPFDGGFDSGDQDGFSDVDERGGFGRDYSFHHDAENGVFIIQIRNWAAFVDDQTGEIQRIIAEGGRFQGKHESCDRYVFTYPHDNDITLRIVDSALRIVEEVDLKEDSIAPTVEEVYNGSDDPVTGHFLLSLGLLGNDNSILSAIMSLDTCGTSLVAGLAQASDFLSSDETPRAGPIDTSTTTLVLADSIYRRSGGDYEALIENSLNRIDLSALSANTNPYVEVDAEAATYFVYGSREENAGMGFVHADENGALAFALRLGTEATRHIESAPGLGTVVAVTGDGRVYWLLYDADLQPSDHIDHSELGAAVYAAHHPTCSADTACPDNGVCVADSDFVNATGTCTPQPPEGPRVFCGGLTDVECESGFQCIPGTGKDELDRCAPRTDCSETEACAAGFICSDDRTYFGSNQCTRDSQGNETCCYEKGAGDYECCGPNGCEVTRTPPAGFDGARCIPTEGRYCGGLNGTPCEDGPNGARACLTELPGLPSGVGLCEAGLGDVCHSDEQCAGDLICNWASGRCEATCATSADCRESGGSTSCVFQDGRGMCDPYAGFSCGDDEIGDWSSGGCTTDKPCDPWREDGPNGCDETETCVESVNGQNGAYCRPGCATTSNCPSGQVCAVDPWLYTAALYCTESSATNGCPCAGDQWCALDTQRCQSGTFCNEQTPCGTDLVCDLDSHTCLPACEINSDCGDGENCVVGQNGERACRLSDGQCSCGDDQYCSPWSGNTCFGAENPPCSHSNQNCAGGLVCNLERQVCIDECSTTADCADGKVCAQLDEYSPIRSCRSRGDSEPQCADGYYILNGSCTRAPTSPAGCSAGVGCTSGHRCNEWANNNLGACICEDLSLCTSCTADSECQTGGICDNGACAWDVCVDGACSDGKTCVTWASSQDPHTGNPDSGATYPEEGICLAPGTGLSGDACSDLNDCASLACLSGICVDRCTQTSDCGGGRTCVAPEAWSPIKFNYCADTACGNGCGDDEVCLASENRCARYASCDHNGGCPGDLVCADYDDYTCRPTCESTTDCAADENCAVRITGGPGDQSLVHYCELLSQSSCAWRCGDGESCNNGQCNDRQPCNENVACPTGQVCDTQSWSCADECTSTAECADGEVCTYGWADHQGNRPQYCQPEADSSCNGGCGPDESCRQDGGYCTGNPPCTNGTCPSGQVCDQSDSCVTACDANSDCEAGEQCVLDTWNGTATCRTPDDNNQCACPDHLACLEPWSGRCGSTQTCSTFSDCNSAQGDGDDYLCEDVGGGRYCVCSDATNTECIDCAGDHGNCPDGLICGSSGACVSLACDPFSSGCPTGTLCARDQSGSGWTCSVATDERPDGISCNSDRECTSGLCSSRDRTCRSPCRDSSDCGQNCTMVPSEPYGECQSVAESPCSSACSAGYVCHNWTSTCEKPCDTTAECDPGDTCERRTHETRGFCQTGGFCPGGCQSFEVCNPDVNSCETP